MAFTRDLVSRLAAKHGFEVVEQAELPGRTPIYLPVPEQLSAKIKEHIKREYPKGLYRHQARAIEAFLHGEDICLTTSTASGKSLVFMVAALELLERDRSSKILALYPARALIQDQINKWKKMLEPWSVEFGFIDGGVAMDRRSGILRSCSVVLMTPDVTHAWLMSRIGEAEIIDFMSRIDLLILDEAHVYEGVFGTNMAYFLRRFQSVSAPHRVICCTATLGKPADFIYQLIGRRPISFGPEHDYSATPPKAILLARTQAGDPFENKTRLLEALSRVDQGRFLAFGDSRKMVEQFVAAVHRSVSEAEDADDVDDDAKRDMQAEPDYLKNCRVLPYRAGYETEDRQRIQRALEHGRLSGVVSTSALELGIDIGEIDLIVLLARPPSVKAFWQRLGRAGRKNPGVCLLIDDDQSVLNGGGLKNYLERPLAPNWLYLENRYIQYTNALCAASELKESLDLGSRAPFQSLPPSFLRLLENELNPAEIVAPDLYSLKQKAQAGPHLVFPIRSGIEQQFKVKGPFDLDLGSLTFSQLLREAYPGAIYYYMARPYRVYVFNYRNGVVQVKRERRRTTRAIAQAMVFPRFEGASNLFRSEDGFVAEVEVQVSERVLGFVEQRGSIKEEYYYGAGSPYYQRELNRFFETTGVCWHFPNSQVPMSEEIGVCILEAFCAEFGVQERDVGIGRFFSKRSPMGSEKCHGICIFDATTGSLRLTQRLAESFADVVEAAIAIAGRRDDHALVRGLNELSRIAKGLKEEVLSVTPIGSPQQDTDWIVLVAPGESAMYISEEGSTQVQVLGYRYTPRGLMYELAPPEPDSKWMVNANFIQPIHGTTKMVRVNLVTDEIEPVD